METVSDARTMGVYAADSRCSTDMFLGRLTPGVGRDAAPRCLMAPAARAPRDGACAMLATPLRPVSTPQVNAVFAALFNAMGLYPLIYAALLIPAARSNRVRFRGRGAGGRAAGARGLAAAAGCAAL